MQLIEILVVTAKKSSLAVEHPKIHSVPISLVISRDVLDTTGYWTVSHGESLRDSQRFNIVPGSLILPIGFTRTQPFAFLSINSNASPTPTVSSLEFSALNGNFVTTMVTVLDLGMAFSGIVPLSKGLEILRDEEAD
ncbi:hypothetical protein WICPIJ_002789 [Wickerhamomyces pijperi]|uniref:Uncharacterized protein n=1 Tax=Wickerhamomyces pijperi TaxID=599730 RepID=A0A9P8QB01_WICPI|nr:hypothetical protein WICPIJ_002789 [Wickerhamomyces pijperi]